LKVNKWLLAILPLGLLSCGVKDYNNLPVHSRNHRINAVVEIPAGTNHIVEYCGATHRFNLKTRADSGHMLSFIPYPFNFGFIPSTLISESGDSTDQPVEVLVLSETISTGEVVEILPIGLISLIYDDGPELFVVAVPCDETDWIINAENFEELNANYPGVVRIIEEWLCYSNPSRPTQNLSWQDELMAVRVIEKYSIN
jgi:inorganic pyrophosphatase